jgi:signal transduction histidine kinase
MSRRTEPFYIPEGTVRLKVSLDSGSPDTTGFIAIDNLSIHALSGGRSQLWQNGTFGSEGDITSLAGTPTGWQRGGDDPAIARMILRSDRPVIGLVDGDQTHHGEWRSTETIELPAASTGTAMISWDETYNVIGGNIYRATYVNVPPGSYRFRAIGLSGYDKAVGDELSLSLLIRPPFWQQFWFLPVITATAVALVALIILWVNRQRAERSLEKLRFQNALESDRSRIARDMHDDLGTRVTFINMSATLAQRDLEQAPQNARRHIAKMTQSTRELIMAMDDLVWAVDPAFDTLDHLGSHLTRLAEEMFKDTPVRCRLDIPALLPPLSLGSDVRHHIALAVKEALHNVLCHAGPSEVFFSLQFTGEEIRITIRDTGVGFDLGSDERGHGLDNLASRFKEIGGTCKITSSPGAGTCIVLSCPVAHAN